MNPYLLHNLIMISTVTEVTIATITANTYAALSTTVSIVIILLLLVLLIQKELVRALDKPQTKEWMQAFDIAIWPLSLAFGSIIISRLLGLLN